jgi:hypothetical protein
MVPARAGVSVFARQQSIELLNETIDVVGKYTWLKWGPDSYSASPSPIETSSKLGTRRSSTPAGNDARS